MSQTTGWDTLHNEFNFKLSFIRNIFGVWREYQGLGAVAAHAESADLPRQIFIFIESFVLPLNFLRYSYVFLTLILGPLGVYFLLDRVTLKSVDPTNRHIAAFIAALYYLLNLATVQLFYVPFEMFQTQFAFLPWLMLFSIKYFETGSVKQLALFAVFTVFALPQAYAPVLFYAYFAGITVFFFIETLVNRKNNLHTYIKRGLLIVVTTLAINAYWLLPNIYYVINHSHDVTNAIVNKVFSDEAFSYNEKFGSVKNVALLKNFLFDWKVYEDNGVFGDLLHAWNNHLSNTLTLVLGYGMFALVIVGGFFSFKDRSRFGYGFGALLLLALFMIINTNFPTGPIFSLLLSVANFLQEALRFVFNKFATLALLSYVVFIGYGLSKLFSFIKRQNLIYLAGTLLIGATIWYGLPAFQGEMIGKYMEQDIPKEYFQLYDWFSNHPVNGRIAKLPIQNYDGWLYYDWGYQGAGFLWFGLDAPLLDRDFDRWTPYNEQYYWEMSHAIYSHDQAQLEQILEKYQIEWIILDHNVIEPGGSDTQLYLYDTHDLFNTSNKITLAQQFGDINVYRVNLTGNYQSFVFGPEGATTIDTNGVKDFNDLTYGSVGNYIDMGDSSDTYMPFQSLFDGEYVDTKSTSEGYRFTAPLSHGGELQIPNLFDNLKYLAVDVAVSTNDDGKTEIVFTPQLPKIFVDGNSAWNEGYDYHIEYNDSANINGLTINGSDYMYLDKVLLKQNGVVQLGQTRLSLISGNNTIELRNKDNGVEETINVIDQSLEDYLNQYSTSISITENSHEIAVVVPFHLGYLQKDYQLTPAGYQNNDSLSTEPKSCAQERSGQLQTYDKTISTIDGGYTEYRAKNSSSCDNFGFWELGQDTGYVLAIEHNNISGFPLYVCLANYDSSKCDQRTRLTSESGRNTQLIIQPPFNSANTGYGVSIDTISLNNQESINQVRSIKMQSIPFDFIKQLSVKNGEVATITPAIIADVQHTTPFLYKVSLEQAPYETLLALNQGFEKSWVGIASSRDASNSPSLLKHYRLNNWANAFVVPSGATKITIVFTAELLQFFGYATFALTSIIIAIFLVTNKRSR